MLYSYPILPSYQIILSCKSLNTCRTYLYLPGTGDTLTYLLLTPTSYLLPTSYLPFYLLPISYLSFYLLPPILHPTSLSTFYLPVYLQLPILPPTFLFNSYLPFYLLPSFLPPTSLSTSYLPPTSLSTCYLPLYLLPPFLSPTSFTASYLFPTSYLPQIYCCPPISQENNEDYRHILISTQNASIYPQDAIVQSVPRIDRSAHNIPQD